MGSSERGGGSTPSSSIPTQSEQPPSSSSYSLEVESSPHASSTSSGSISVAEVSTTIDRRKGEEAVRRRPTQRGLFLIVLIPVGTTGVLVIILCVIFLTIKRGVLSEPDIRSNHRLNGSLMQFNSGDFARNTPFFSILETNDYKQDTCKAQSRYGLEEGNKGAWMAGVNPVSAVLPFGIYLFDFQYQCGRKTSKIKTIKATIDPTLSDILMNNVVQSNVPVEVLFDEGAPDKINYIELWKGDENFSLFDKRTSAIEFHREDTDLVLTGIENPPWLYEYNVNIPYLTFTLTQPGDYSIKTSNENESINTRPFVADVGDAELSGNTLIIKDSVSVVSTSLVSGFQGDELIFGAGVKQITPGAFRGLSVIKFRVSENNINLVVSSNGSLLTSNGEELIVVPPMVSGSFTVPTSIKYIRDMAFCDSRISSITIHKDVTTIGTDIFTGVNNPIRLLIPDITHVIEFKLNDDTTLFDHKNGFVLEDDFVGDPPSATLHIHTFLEDSPLTSALGTLFECRNEGDGYFSQNTQVFTEKEEADHSITTGLCYMSGDKLIPLLENDDQLVIQIDAIPPAITITAPITAFNGITFRVIDGRPNISYVTVTQGGKNVEVTKDLPTAGEESFHLSCNQALDMCTFTTVYFTTFSISTSDMAGNESSLEDLTPIDWTCSNSFDSPGSLLIPFGIEHITSNSLGDCADATSITVSKTVSSIDSDTFDGFANLSQFLVDQGNEWFKTYAGDKALYKISNETQGKLLRFPAGSTDTSFILNNTNISTVGDHAFKGCHNLTSVTLHQGIELIEDGAFEGCGTLLRIVIEGLTSTTLLKLNDSVTQFDPTTNYITENEFVGDPPKVTLHISETLDNSEMETILKSPVLCMLVSGVYSPKDSVEFESKADSKHTISTGLCYKEGEGLIPLFSGDKTHEVIVDTEPPLAELPDVFMVWRDIIINMSDSGSGVSTVEIIQNGLPLTATKTEANVGDDNFGISCDFLANTCAFHTTSKSSVLVSLKDVVGHETVIENVDPVDWHCVPDDLNSSVLTVPDAADNLTLNSFSQCGLAEKLVLPRNVVSVSEDAFDKLESLTSIEVTLENTVFTAVDGVLYSLPGTGLRSAWIMNRAVNLTPDILVRYPPSKANSEFEVEASITKIAPHAFYKSRFLTRLTLNSTITEIGEGAFESSKIMFLLLTNTNLTFKLNGDVYPSDQVVVLYDDDFTNNVYEFVISASLPETKFNSTTLSRFKIKIGEETHDSLTSTNQLTRNGTTATCLANVIYKDRDVSMKFLGDFTIEFRQNLEAIFEQETALSELAWPIRYIISDERSFSISKEGITGSFDLKTDTTYAIYDNTTRTISFNQSGIYTLMVGFPDGGSQLQTVKVTPYVCEVPSEVTSINDSDLVECKESVLLQISSTVTSIHKNALLYMSKLKAIIADTSSLAKPEDCDFGLTDKIYNHIPTFRVNVSSPPKIAVPVQYQFKEGTKIPVLHFADAAGEALSYGSNKLVAEKRRYNYYTLTSIAGRLTISQVSGTASIEVEVVVWEETQKNFGVDSSLQDGTFDLVIPYGVYSISPYQYYNNQKLKSVTLSPTLKVVGQFGFHSCSNVATINLSNGVREIKDSAFFKDTGLTNLDVPGSVNSIETLAFGTNPNLSTIKLNEGISSLGERAFSQAAVSVIDIPLSVHQMTGNPFHMCSNLETISSSNPIYKMDEDGFGFYNSENGVLTTFLHWKANSPEEYTVPSKIRKLGGYLMDGNNTLTKVVVHQGVSEIEAFCFANCPNLVKVAISEGTSKLGDLVFSNSFQLSQLTIPVSLRTGTVGNYALYLSSIFEVCFVSAWPGECDPLTGDGVALYGKQGIITTCDAVCP